jgi:(1->4)-alpha-D-glucan 1-alpha-D-glucosylmutase
MRYGTSRWWTRITGDPWILILLHRREHPELYRDGDYVPLKARGEAAEHIVSFARTLGEESVIAVVPRLLRSLRGGEGVVGLDDSLMVSDAWRETWMPLPPGSYRNVFTGEIVNSNGEVEVEQIFASFPVALLEKIVS